MKTIMLAAGLLALTCSARAAVITPKPPSQSGSSGRQSAPSDSPGSQSGLTSAATAATVPANPYPLKIVTCREGTDLDALIAAHQLQPKFIYRAIHGFAAIIPEAAMEGLKHNPHVLAVESDGPVSLCGQVNGYGVVRMGVDQFLVARINGFTEPIDVDVAVRRLLPGIRNHNPQRI